MSIKTTTIYDLKVCSIKEPYGVDENPVFSWKMRSDVLGQKQSAYMIELKKARCKNDEMVWNTGKVFSDESMFVSCGVPLEPMTAYDWTLTVWDKDDNALESQSSRFVTGVIDQNWNNAKWLTVYDQTTEYKDITDYTIETSFILIKNETNFLIATGSHLHYYRFRFFVSGEALLLESYWYAPDGDYRRCGEQINVSELLAILPEEINTLELQLRFCVSPDEIITYVDKQPVHQLKITSGMPYPLIGAPGFHFPGAFAGCYVGRMITRESSTGRILYDYDFQKENPFANTSVENGMLKGVATGRLFPKCPSFAVRKEFELSQKPVEAILSVSGMGVFCSYLNGKRVANVIGGEETPYELTPGNTEGRIRRHYYTYDITDNLNVGVNTLSAIVTSGWWSDLVNICHGERNAVIAKLVIRYEDGDEKILVTDETWKADTEACPAGYCSIFSGEEYDASKPTKFMLCGYDDSKWSKASLVQYNGSITSGFKAPIYNRKDLEHAPIDIKIFNGIHNADDTHYGTVDIVRTYSADDTMPFSLNAGETAVVDFGYNCA